MSTTETKKLSLFDTWILQEAERVLADEISDSDVAHLLRGVLRDFGQTREPPADFDAMLAQFADTTDCRRAFAEEEKHYCHEASVLEQLLVEKCAADGTQSIKRNGKTFYLARETSVTVLPEQRAAAVDAARSLGLADMIVIQPQRFAGYAREQLSDDGPGKLPAAFDGLVKVFEQTRMRVRNS